MQGSQFGRSPISLPRPGKALKGVLLGLLGIWLIFALGINWGGAQGASFLALCGNTQGILSGEVWRLLTAPVLHMYTGTVWHLISAMLGLYFLGASLEQEWGPRRFLRFLALTGVLAYGAQALIDWALPARVGAKLVPEFYFGAMPVVQAVAIAWACSFRGRTVQLFFVLPISSRGLILFVVGLSVLYLIAGATPPSGHVAMFAGMGLGWLLGGSTPSPLRRAYLRFRLARLEVEARRDGQQRRQRAKQSGLRVIPGGREGGGPTSGSSSNRGGSGGSMLH